MNEYSIRGQLFGRPSAWGTVRKTGSSHITYTLQMYYPNEEMCRALVEALEAELKPEKHEYRIGFYRPLGTTRTVQYVTGDMFFSEVGERRLRRLIMAKSWEARRIMKRVVEHYGYGFVPGSLSW
jgi:hypothetical protein